jgi:hypothetical protein
MTLAWPYVGLLHEIAFVTTPMMEIYQTCTSDSIEMNLEQIVHVHSKDSPQFNYCGLD